MKIFPRSPNDEPLRKVKLILTAAERQFLLSDSGCRHLEDFRLRYGSDAVDKLVQSADGEPFVFDVQP